MSGGSRAPTVKVCIVGIVYCQHLVVTKDGAINDHDRGGAASIDAATLECTSVTKTGRTGGQTADGRRRYRNTALRTARAGKMCSRIDMQTHTCHRNPKLDILPEGMHA